MRTGIPGRHIFFIDHTEQGKALPSCMKGEGAKYLEIQFGLNADICGGFNGKGFQVSSNIV